MTKVKNSGKKKSSLSLAKKNAIKNKVTNPFEVHVNRQKYEVLGRKVKNDRGLPGVSRAKAMKKRKETLLQEYKVKDKSNKFMDRRIGEKNMAMTGEDKIMARFTAERMKTHNKKSMYNLADDEVLTHHGQTLNELEKFDDPRSDDEDEADTGKLDADFVKEAHFGGGILSKPGNPQSRKDLIEQLIVESKKRKADQKKSREETQDLTDTLDTEWKDLLPIIATSKRKTGDSSEAVEKPDEYDTMMRELKFEARGKPSDRLKSEEEIVKEEKERLEQLEADRMKRMRGITEADMSKTAHRSADDWDDGFDIESVVEENTVHYDAEGKLEMPTFGQEGDENDDEEMETDGEEKNSEEDQTDSEEESEDGEEEDDFADLKSDSEKEDEKRKSSETFRVPATVDIDMEAESSVQYLSQESDVESKRVINIHSDSDNSRSTKSSQERLRHNGEVTDGDAEKIHLEETHRKSLEVENIKKDLLERKRIMEIARKELPYTFKVPESYEGLNELLSNRTPDYQAVIVERIIKCNHPSLAEGNKDKLATLLAYLLQHIHDTATQEHGECFVVLDRLAPHIYDLAIMEPKNAQRCIAEVLKEKQVDYRKNKREFPQQDTLVFLKLISLLFPTSDFKHPVTIPAFVFMGQMLTQCQVKTRRDVATGLFLVNLVLEYTVLSKRFCPEAINFLQRLLSSSLSEKAVLKHKIMNISPDYTQSSTSVPVLLSLRELSTKDGMDDSFAYRALHMAIRMLREFAVNLDEIPAVFQIFSPVKTFKVSLAPRGLREEVESLQITVAAMEARNMPRLVPESKKPKLLRLYEPKIERVFEGRKHKVMGRERQEKEKLLHKVKREMKGAIREIRRDKTFLAKLKIKQTKISDLERRAKVKAIYGDASTQQGELKALARKK